MKKLKHYNILLIGTGRIGKIIAKYLKSQNQYRLTNLDFITYTAVDKELLELIKFDYIIDFSHSQSIAAITKTNWRGKPAFLIGTTGYNQAQKEQLIKLSNKYPILYDSNFSLGINIIHKIIQENKSLFAQYDLAIEEIHHQHKLDSPSGTALSLANHFPNHPPIKSVRMGEELGIHKLMFNSPNEELIITHRVKNSDLFVKGLVMGMTFLCNKEPGLYNFGDVLCAN